MVQVIQLHPYKQSYPFGLQKQSDCTYVELIKEITSETQLFIYEQNLALFKSIQSDLVIPLDSYVKQGNTLQLYYQYQPLSIKHYIQERLVMMLQDQQRDKFLTRVITSINVAIQDVITLMMGKKIMALLSIENMAIDMEERIKFFIEPDFEYTEKLAQNQLTEYYTTEKKKLQIQLEEFLEHIFQYTNSKPKDHGKANFVIQGTKLVFVNEQETNRQSSMSGVSVIPGAATTTATTTTATKNNPGSGNVSASNNSSSTTNSGITHLQKHQIKLPAYMLKQPKQSKQLPQQPPNINNSSKQKFDIKNILDEKKLQKNQPHFKEHSSKGHGEQSILDRSPTKNSFTENSNNNNDVNGKNINQKDVKNYFENNDDFNKDASFYPQEFIKEDSIAEFQGYEDELQKQLQDLKKKKYQAQQLANTSKNRLSMVPNTPINPQLDQQKMNKSPNPQQGQSSKPITNQQFPQNVLNSSDSRENDTSQEQSKQKKKYKVTITTSHLVDVDDEEADLRTIEQELIQDIKNGGLMHDAQGNGNGTKLLQQPQQLQNDPQLKGNNSEKEIIGSPNIPAHLLKGHTRETHIPNTLHQTLTPHQTITIPQQKPAPSNNDLAPFLTQQPTTQDKPFSKQPHPHLSSQTATYSSLGVNKQYNSNAFTHGGNTTTSNQQAPDIKKIIEKIKNNSQNHQFINSTAGLTQAQGNSQNNNNSTIVKPQTIPKEQPVHITATTIAQKPLDKEEDTRPHSQLSSQSVVTNSNTLQNSEKKEQEKEYLDKIQKAKMKAEEIMKLVKERKGQ